MSRTFSTKSGSLESLKVSTRCGFRPKARQMRQTAVWLSPVALASERVLQCVASAGVASRVVVTACSTCSSVILRGAPGRLEAVLPTVEQAVQPAFGEAPPPERHRRTAHPNRLAICCTGSPSADARITRARSMCLR